LNFTYALQKTGYAYDQTDPQGPTDLDGFMRALDAFPWTEQLVAWDELQDGPLPGLVLTHTASKAELWVGAMGLQEISGYQLHYASMQVKKAMFGMGKEKEHRVVITADVDTRQEADDLCRLFYEGQTDALVQAFKQYQDLD
jgi:hypothetical protein